MYDKKILEMGSTSKIGVNIKNATKFLVLHDLEEGMAHFKFCSDKVDVQECVMEWLGKEYSIDDIKVVAIDEIVKLKLKVDV